MAALSARHLYKVFGKHPEDVVERLEAGETREQVSDQGTAAVIDASFDVEPGEIFVVMGLSGSGKSTLIRMLNGLLPASGGSVEIGGVDITSASPAQVREIRREKVSMVFQSFALLPHRTVLDNVSYGLEIQGMNASEREAKALEVIRMTGLDGWEHNMPSELSGGMKQRVGLARALAADSEILLMDEAFSALDPLIRKEMQDQLVELQTSLGKTIVFITHDLNEAVRLGDRIAVMRDGRIVQIGRGEEILSNPANEYVARFIADVDRSRVITASSLMRRPNVLVYGADGPTVALKKIDDSDGRAAYVVDRIGHLLGSVYDEELVAAREGGAETLDGLIHADTCAVGPDAALGDLFGPAVEARLPLPVTDESGRLLGVVSRVALLRAMSPAGDLHPGATSGGATSGGATAGPVRSGAHAARPPAPHAPASHAARLHASDVKEF